MYSVIVGLALTLAGCSTDDSVQSSSQAQAARSSFTCEAKDLFSGRVEIRSGGSQEEACARAQDECFTKSGNHCVVLRWYDDQTTADGMTSGQGWACRVQENTGTGFDRSWVRPGATINEARSNALSYCERRKAGINCLIVSCFDASFERL
jgi:hypothetical protein